MESLGGLEFTSHPESEETSKTSEKIGPVEVLRIISLIFSGLTGLSALGLFGGAFWSLIDLNYYALLSQMDAIGYICLVFAIINVLTSLIFKKNLYVFIVSSFLTSIFGSFQFIVFAISPFSHGVFGHYQYVISFVLSLILLVLVYAYIFSSRKEEMREKD